MLRITHIRTTTSRTASGASHVWQTVASQPGWVTRMALMTFLIVIGVPIMLLVLTAVLLAVIVFMVLAGAHAIYTRLRGLLPSRDGRENVRIIHRTQ